MVIERVAIEKLVPAGYNPRIHSEEFLQKLENSIDEFGYVEPIVWNKRTGNVVGGHARLKILQKKGEKELDVVVVDLPEEKEKAFNVALNKVSGEFDDLKLAELIQTLSAEDLALTGLDDNEISVLLDKLNNERPDEDNIPENVPAIAKAGDLFKLGDHRLLCGNSTSTDDIAKLMAGVKADMVFTDPPYNVNYQSGAHEKILNDNISDDSFYKFLFDVFANMKSSVKDGSGVYIFHATKTQSQFEKALIDNGFAIRNTIIWNKPSLSMGWSDYQWKHEPCFYAGIKGVDTVFYGNRANTTVWDFHSTDEDILKIAKRTRAAEKQGKTTIWSVKRDKTNEYVHPTQKPVQLIEFALKNSSKQGDIVLDLFSGSGSGSTLIACEKNNRISYGVELDPHYVDVIIKRWEDFTGKTAEKI